MLALRSRGARRRDRRTPEGGRHVSAAMVPEPSGGVRDRAAASATVQRVVEEAYRRAERVTRLERGRGMRNVQGRPADGNGRGRPARQVRHIGLHGDTAVTWKAAGRGVRAALLVAGPVRAGSEDFQRRR